MTPEERKIRREWLAGKKVESLRFLYNSRVKETLPDGRTGIGWIVGAREGEKEPIYTVELADGTGDEECPQSKIQTVENSE